MASTPSPSAAFTDAAQTFRARLLRLAERHMHPMLLQRMSAEDVLQETLQTAMRHPAFLDAAPEVPIYFKLRRLLFQTLVDAERRHLKANKRDLYRELPIEIDDTSDTEAPHPHLPEAALAADISSPFTKTARHDRYALLKRVLATLPTTDRQILALRHFDNCTNAECAAALAISEKAASLRYVRALAKLQERLEQFTEFH